MKNKFTTVNKQICLLEKHAKVANEEMGVVKADVAVIKNDIGWLKDSNKNQTEVITGIDNKIWWVLGGVILSIFTTILFILAK